MKVLVTGSSGFVGTALCAELRRHGHDVRGALRAATRSALHREPCVIGNINGETDWSCALADMDLVVHLAARVHVMNETVKDPSTLFDTVNNSATRNLFLAASGAGVKRFLFLSTVKVNGESTRTGYPFTEDGTPAPHDAYAWSKYYAEEGIKELATEYGMEWVIIRPPLVYGPGVKANFAALMRAVQRGLPLPLGAVDNLRSLVGLDNLVDFIITCTKHPSAANQTFLVSDGEDISTPDLIRAMARAAARPSRLFPVPVSALASLASLAGRRAAVDRLCSSLQVDISKARDFLQWTPPVSLHEGLRRAFVGVAA